MYNKNTLSQGATNESYLGINSSFDYLHEQY